MDISELKIELNKSMEKLKEDFAGIRIGRASAQLVENLSVDYYGVKSPLIQIAQITVPDPMTIMIAPWNKDDLVNIEKAINESDLGLTPSNDGEQVILKLPPMTEERRGEITKLVGQKAEEVRVNIRQKREKLVDELNEKRKDGSVSEDEYFARKEEVQKLVDEYIGRVDELREKKEKEITTI